MLIEYIRECDPVNGGRGNPIGCIVAIGRNQLGWSLTNPKDHFHKGLAVEIAAGRAECGTVSTVPSRLVFHDYNGYVPVADLIQEGLLRMQARAERYFK